MYGAEVLGDQVLGREGDHLRQVAAEGQRGEAVELLLIGAGRAEGARIADGQARLDALVSWWLDRPRPFVRGISAFADPDWLAELGGPNARVLELREGVVARAFAGEAIDGFSLP